MVRIKSKKWPLLRILALGRALRPASRGITTSLYGTAFVRPAQHDFCFSSFFNH